MDGRMRQGGHPGGGGGGGGGGGKRNRGRGGRRPFGGSNSNNNSSSNRNQVLDSNGPSVRIRGNPLQIFEKYQQLARDSALSGDRVAAENLLQHAEHFYRIFSAANANAPRPPQAPEGGTPTGGSGRSQDGGPQPQQSHANGEQPGPGNSIDDGEGDDPLPPN